MSTKWWTENSSKLSDELPQKMNPNQPRRGKWMRTALVLMLGAALAVTSGCSLLPKEEDEEVLPPITPPQVSKKPEYTVTTTTLETAVTGSGKLLSVQEETASFQLDGMKLKSIAVKPGDNVKEGQVIAELDVTAMEKSLRSDRLKFRTQEVQMKETLRKRDELSDIEFEEAVIVFEQAKQDILDKEADIAKAKLTAPFSGTVISVTAKKGDSIKSYDPIAIIADTTHLLVAANVSKDKLNSIAIGMPVEVDINNAGKHQGKVKQFPMKQDDNNNGNPGGNNNSEKPEDFLIVELDKMPEDLNRGTPLSIKIITNRKENAIVIPPSALRTIGSRTYVQVVDGEGRREVDVAVGQQTSTQVEILEGLKPGQKVVGR
ncbi:efflux RND transporter periplasmic adaptor subunit [Paenibacillus sp. GCM10012307]|uniref:Efflux RND transporter periplasmic adaptor subunit n=1 Tax=Paenibacillus roseus TaxID=2798579 RepID=A0A934MRS9_9BACL|nr:efflux RND transporter periplasmic adaptor subunit [Paenibacillus roseus]MBJ6363188.1 efflux RND transporter periplasmic adaptor subunit [Paenibacillus roseus]